MQIRKEGIEEASLEEKRVIPVEGDPLEEVEEEVEEVVSMVLVTNVGKHGIEHLSAHEFSMMEEKEKKPECMWWKL